MDFDIPQCTIPDIIASHAYHSPRKTAAIFGDRRISWEELNAGINRVANRLIDAGLQKGERVAFLMRSSFDHFCLFFGSMKAGGVAVPLSSLLSPEQLAGLVHDASAQFLFTDSTHQRLLDPVLAEMASVRPDGFFSDEGRDHWRSMEHWLKGSFTAEPTLRLLSDDDANISYSSGTTGVPKGVVYSHRARLHFGFSYAVHMHIDSASVGIVTTPLYSNGTSIIMFPVLFAGGTLIFMDGFDAGEFQRIVERERATHTFMVPTQFVKVLAHPDFGHHDLSSVVRFVTAGSPMRMELKQEVMEKLGCRLSDLYGLSEGGVCMIRPDDLREHPQSCGTPLPGFECRIIGSDDEELPRGETGEIVFYGGWAMRRYHNRPDQTREAIWRDSRGRSFVRSGDIGRMDEDGRLYVVDRKKDMIISGGFNIFPADIEAVVSTHPAVQDVCVVGVPHPLWGESPVAAVILHSNMDADVEEIRTWANARLAKTQRIAAVVARDDFPRNAMGKVVKPELRSAYSDLLMAS
jgi:acyl-CoA synthetase (AMP-forming)/AMP-acid ligase II